MAKMDESDFLDLLKSYEDDAAQYVTGALRKARDRSWKEYFQRPYGDEEEGWSQFVSSDVADTVEWMLPDLLDLFLSNDKAVEFAPNKREESEGAKQATQGVNHVFYEQNNGFMVLYTAFKDALMARNGCVHWRTETVRKRRTVNYKDLTDIERAAKIASLTDIVDDDYEVEETDEQFEQVDSGMPPTLEMDYMTGAMMPKPAPMIEQRRTSGRIVYITERKQCRAEAFEPENMLIQRRWTTPLLDRCPYVCRLMEVTLSDLQQMGFKDIEAEDLAGSEESAGMEDDIASRQRSPDGGELDGLNNRRTEGVDVDDESQTSGWLRIEWVLADFDGDGIAERREIWRLSDKILSNEECDEVPIATGSPVLIQHRWDGLSIGDLVGDLQLLRTELMRGVINNAYASNNPRKVILADPVTFEPYVDMVDLLDGRPGGNIREYRANAIRMEQTAYVGNAMDPLLQRVDTMREERTGVTKQRMGMDPNAIRSDRTLGETQIIDQASKQRIKLIGRILAETIVKPMMKGILHLLSSGDYDKLYFELRGEYVEYDPNEWDDGYRMKTNVGLGTGDRDQQFATLKGIYATQMQLAQSPLGSDRTEPVMGPDGKPLMGPDGKPQTRMIAKGMVTPKQMFNTLDRMTDIGGFKNSGEFFTDPGPAPMPGKPPEPPPPAVIVAQIRAKAEADKLQAMQAFEQGKFRAEAEAKQLEQRDQNEVQRANDERDAQRELEKASIQERIDAASVALARYKVDQDNQVKIITTYMTTPEAQLPPGYAIDPDTGLPVGPDALAPVMAAISAIAADTDAPAEIIYHPDTGEPVGVMKNGKAKDIVYDDMGRPASLQ